MKNNLFEKFEYIIGTKKDDSQYLKLKYKNITERYISPSGRQYIIELKGECSITNYKGSNISSAEMLEEYIITNRERELNHDTIAYFAIASNENSSNPENVLFSMADVKSYISTLE